MSKKSLLNEGIIRRFMKLAELEPLTSPFIQRLDEAPEDETDEMEVDLDVTDDEGGEELDLDLGDDSDMEMDLGDDEEMEMGAEGDPMETLADELKDVIVDKLEGMIADGTLEISDGEEAEDIDLEDAAEEGEFDAEVDVDVEPDLDAADVDVEPSEEEIVTEVARRVAKRILSTRH